MPDLTGTSANCCSGPPLRGVTVELQGKSLTIVFNFAVEGEIILVYTSCALFQFTFVL